MIALNPNYAIGYSHLGEELIAEGKPEEALSATQKAIPLDPQLKDFYSINLGVADIFMRRFQQALPPLERFAWQYPNLLESHILLSIAYTELGRDPEAHAEAAEVRRLNPQFRVASKLPMKDSVLARRFDADLSKAGLN
jgi:tetratricopeptide (TPR) repeat protein